MKMLPVGMAKTGGRKTRRLSLASRREVTWAVAVRYQSSPLSEKESILDVFTQVTGLHRKYAIRVLNQKASKLDRSKRDTANPRFTIGPCSNH